MGSEAKQTLIDALDADFSAELLAVLGRKFPVVNPVAVPSSVEDAMIITGQTNANFNNQFLTTLSGLPVYELLLKAGQLNKVFQNMLLSGLQYSGDTAISSIIAPKQGTYYGYFDGWQVSTERENPQTISITCNGQTESMSNAGGVWTCAFPIPIGSHSATVTMTYANGKSSQESVSFVVKHWSDLVMNLSENTATVDPENSIDVIEKIILRIGEEDIILEKEQGLLSGAVDVASDIWMPILQETGRLFKVGIVTTKGAIEEAIRIVF